MKYVTMQIGFKSGRVEDYRIEIEPHELEETKILLEQIVTDVYNFLEGVNEDKSISFSSIKGEHMVNLASIESFFIDRFEVLYK